MAKALDTEFAWAPLLARLLLADRMVYTEVNPVQTVGEETLFSRTADPTKVIEDARVFFSIQSPHSPGRTDAAALVRFAPCSSGSNHHRATGHHFTATARSTKTCTLFSAVSNPWLPDGPLYSSHVDRPSPLPCFLLFAPASGAPPILFGTLTGTQL
jgi:hypothetical protein